MNHRSVGLGHSRPSFAFEINALSREIDVALVKRAGGVALASMAALGLGVAPGFAQAATITVNSRLDKIDDDGLCTLREAISNANESMGADTTARDCATGAGTAADEIVFASDVTGTIALNIASYGNLEVSLSEPLTITGPGADLLTVDGQNTAPGTEDGGIVYANADLTLKSLTLANGETTGDGGAIFATNSLYLEGVTLRGSYAGQSAGAFYAGGGVTVNNSKIVGNRAGAFGGGFNVVDDVTLIGSTLSGNEAGLDATAVLRDSGAGASYGGITAINSTISGNTAYTYAGGLYSYGDIKLYHTTVTGNTATTGSGGGLNGNFAGIYLYNSIVAGNSAGVGEPDIDVRGNGVTSNDSLIGIYTGTVTGTGNIVGTGTPVDPGLGPLADNGGPTYTHALDYNSPAFNAGSAAYTTGLSYDQRGTGYARSVFGAPDMGAFEFQGPIPVSLGIDKTQLDEAGADNPATISACLPSGITVGEAIAVTLSVTGTATAGTDHDLGDPSQVTIAANANCGTLAFNATDDGRDEPDETVVVDIDALPDGYSEAGTGQVNATITDDDISGITVDPTALTTTEAGGADSFTVVLNTPPADTVTVNLAGDTTEGSLSNASLSFTASNWNVAQTVTVTGVDDTADDGDVTYIIATTVSSNDPDYGALDPADVAVTNQDNDQATVAVADLSLSVGTIAEEDPAAKANVSFKSGHTTTLTITLTDPAPGDVTLTLGADAASVAELGSDFTITPNPVIIAQGETQGTATIAAVPDTIAEGDEPFTVVVTSAICTPDCQVTLPDPAPEASGLITDNDQVVQDPATPIPALGPLGLVLLPLLIPMAAWRYARRRFLA